MIEEGFEPVNPPLKDGDVIRSLPGSKPSFSRLGYLGAYIINAPGQNWEKVVEEKLGDDYEILPDITLSLPSELEVEEIGAQPQRRKNTSWPEESGVNIAHKDGITGYGVIVGVLDTGCDADHDEFKDRPDGIEFIYVNPQDSNATIRDQRAFDVSTHGTHVCGIVAGSSIGVAPDADLMVASVVGGSDYRTTLERLLYGLNWMLARFRDDRNLGKPMIINMSLGVPADKMENDYSVVNRRLKRVFETLLHDYAVLPIVAIGNEGQDKVRAPGYYTTTLSVGAVDMQLQPTDFTSYGISPDGGKMQPDIVGYGLKVYSGFKRNKGGRSLYTTDSGTSMAAPYVTGIAALYAAENSSLRGIKLLEKLLETALPLESSSEKVGKGLARYTRGQ